MYLSIAKNTIKLEIVCGFLYLGHLSMETLTHFYTRVSNKHRPVQVDVNQSSSLIAQRVMTQCSSVIKH